MKMKHFSLASKYFFFDIFYFPVPKVLGKNTSLIFLDPKKE